MNNAPHCRASVHGGWKTRGWCFLESWGSSCPLCASYSVSDMFLMEQMKQFLTCSSTDVSLKALRRPPLYAQHCIMKCVHCSEYDRAAASALGRVHLYLTGAHAAFEHAVSVSPLLPSFPLSLYTHTRIPRKGPDNLMPLSHPPLCNLPHCFPHTRYLVRTCKAFPLQGSEVSQRFL